MKRIAIIIGVLAAILFAAQTARAFEIPNIPQGPGIPEIPEIPRVPIPNVPTAASPVGGIGAGIALETALNAKISHAKCAFEGATSETTCNLVKLGRELAATATTGAHTGHTVTVTVDAGPAEGIDTKKEQKSNARERADAVCEKLSEGFENFANPPSCNARPSGSTNKLTISVRVDY